VITLDVKKASNHVPEYDIPSYYDVLITDDAGNIVDTMITAQQALEIARQLRDVFSPLVME
jgi:hypothetical protein